MAAPDPWRALSHELDRWHRAGRQATFWWRDDDAVAVTPQLERLVDIAARHGVPLALAVIPAATTTAFADMLQRHSMIDVVQHGWSHTNHAPPHAKKAEFGPHRPHSEMETDLRAGWQALAEAFAPQPVLVPPWNRISSGFERTLPRLGYKILSTFRARSDFEDIAGLVRVNTHADLIDWRGTRGFAGDASVLGDAIAHLENRRNGQDDPGEPTGLLTHHLVHDNACWTFLERIFALTCAHPAVVWLTVAQAARLDHPEP